MSAAEIFEAVENKPVPDTAHKEENPGTNPSIFTQKCLCFLFAIVAHELYSPLTYVDPVVRVTGLKQCFIEEFVGGKVVRKLLGTLR
jgi:hypothetical protein